MFLGEELYKFYSSFDSFKDETRNLYQQEFLDSISLRGLPPQIDTERNDHPLCWYRILTLRSNHVMVVQDCFAMIDCEILIVQFAGSRVFLPEIPMKTSKNMKVILFWRLVIIIVPQ